MTDENGKPVPLNEPLQYKESGTHSLTLKCQNTLGKWSDPYTVEFEVFEDIAPNIELNLMDKTWYLSEMLEVPQLYSTKINS